MVNRDGSKTLRESGLLGGKSVFVYCSRHKIRQPKKPDEFSAFRNNDSELRVEDQKTNGNRGVLTAPRGHSHRDVSRFFHCLLLIPGIAEDLLRHPAWWTEELLDSRSFSPQPAIVDLAEPQR
ncbi:hypothetical protein STEG23_031184, partial [Scotinomys teguina]